LQAWSFSTFHLCSKLPTCRTSWEPDRSITTCRDRSIRLPTCWQPKKSCELVRLVGSGCAYPISSQHRPHALSVKLASFSWDNCSDDCDGRTSKVSSWPLPSIQCPLHWFAWAPNAQLSGFCKWLYTCVELNRADKGGYDVALIHINFKNRFKKRFLWKLKKCLQTINVAKIKLKRVLMYFYRNVYKRSFDCQNENGYFLFLAGFVWYFVGSEFVANQTKLLRRVVGMLPTLATILNNGIEICSTSATMDRKHRLLRIPKSGRVTTLIHQISPLLDKFLTFPLLPFSKRFPFVDSRHGEHV